MAEEETIGRREVVAQGVFYALFRVVEIDELSGPERALEWARAMVDEPELRLGFADGVLEAFDARAARRAEPGEESRERTDP